MADSFKETWNEQIFIIYILCTEKNKTDHNDAYLKTKFNMEKSLSTKKQTNETNMYSV